MSRAVVRSGFTLVEVLVVTVIIGILLALVSAAVFPALQSANEFAITSEASQLSMAMESLKAEYGTGNPPADLRLEFPDSSDIKKSEIYKFVSRTFPRYDVSNLETDLPPALGVAAAADIKFDPGNALVFWLVGFSNNPAAPFEGHADRMNGTKMASPFYEFDIDRLGTDSTSTNSTTGTIRYFPKHSVDNYDNADAQRAFLYFDKKSYDTPYSDFYVYRKFGEDPNPSSTTGYKYEKSYENPRGCQIVNAGLDGQLGNGCYPGYNTPSTPPADTGECEGVYTDANADNLTNFSGGTMGDYTDK